uniref:Uncharacterized protein n=1 Tax=Arcella intermedia TaxID=1963864 RepID=A0A6B2LVD7_9EUKA
MDAIDLIFAKKGAAPAKNNIPRAPTPGAKIRDNDSDFWRNSRGIRKQIDGLPVFTTTELGISVESGGTPACPFDCQCCF